MNHEISLGEILRFIANCLESLSHRVKSRRHEAREHGCSEVSLHHMFYEVRMSKWVAIEFESVRLRKQQRIRIASLFLTFGDG